MTWVGTSCTGSSGVRLQCVRTGGEKPPLVLLHGLMGSGACWTPVARALEGEFDVVMPDARGHGGSSAPSHGYRYDDLAADVIELIRALGLARPILLGHSMGGMTAAVVASRAKDLRGLILVDPTFLPPERQREVFESDVAEQHGRLLSRSEEEVLADLRARHPHRSPEICALLARARLQTSLSAFEVLTPPNPDYRELVRQFAAPTLLVIGDNPVVTLDAATELESLNPRVQIEQIPHAGHGLPYDRPERLAAVVQSFLRSAI